jgi:hypothetical protein
MALHLTMYAGLGAQPGEADEEAKQNAAGISKRTYNNGLALKRILEASALEGYSIVEGTGFYEGLKEPCMIVSVICQDFSQVAAAEAGLLDVAKAYKQAARQQEVWITRRVEDLIIV